MPQYIYALQNYQIRLIHTSATSHHFFVIKHLKTSSCNTLKHVIIHCSQGAVWFRSVCPNEALYLWATFWAPPLPLLPPAPQVLWWSPPYSCFPASSCTHMASQHVQGNDLVIKLLRQDLLIYLKGRVIQELGKREDNSIYWFIHLLPTAARTEPGQEPGAKNSILFFSHIMAGAQILDPSSAASQVH